MATIPLLVPEGASFNDDLQVEKVMPDHAVLRQRSSGVTIELPLSLMPGDVPVSLSMSEGQAVTTQWQDEHPPASRLRERPDPPAHHRALVGGKQAENGHQPQQRNENAKDVKPAFGGNAAEFRLNDRLG